MITGEIKSKIDKIWDAFWAGGIANPLEVIEQITYLLFIKRLDDLHTLEENKANRTRKPMERRIFPEGKDEKGRSYEDLRWSRFKHFEPAEMLTVLGEHVFPFLRTLGGDGSTYAHHMKDARFTIPTAALLAKVVDMIDQVPMEDRDTKGDLYEYMLGKIATAGQNGQFRTPRHIIQLMVELTAPTPSDVICDPACGTGGFLVAAGEYMRDHHPEVLRDAKLKKHFHGEMFHGFDFDSTMLRIGSMNMLLHGVENPNIVYRDSLAQEHGDEEERYSLVLANPPFSGSLDYESCAKDLLSVVRTKKTELLFIALFMRLLKPGGRAAVIVPAGVIESDSSAHTAIRRILVNENRLQAVIALPHWVFKPYASVATAVLIIGRGGTTDHVWFYRMSDDGFLDDANKTPSGSSQIPHLLSLWKKLCEKKVVEGEKRRHRLVSREEIEANEFDLCDRVYLSGYEYPSGVPLATVEELFEVQKGLSAASEALDEGQYPFVTSAETVKRADKFDFAGEAICIPTVSATGHGHASIKHIHHVEGQFAAATITAVMMLKPESSERVYVPYIYYFLLANKNDVLVPLMRGAANISLNIERLKKLKIPLPEDIDQQKLAVRGIEAQKRKLVEARQSVLDLDHSVRQLVADFGAK